MKKIVFLLLLLLPIVNSCEVSGDPELLELMLEIKNQNEELREELKSLQAKSDSLLNSMKANEENSALISKKMDEVKSELEKVLKELAEVNSQLQKNNADMEMLKAQLAALNEKYEVLLVKIEKLQELTQLLGKMEELKKQIEVLNQKSDKLEEMLVGTNSEIQELKSSIEKVQRELIEVLSQIGFLTEQLSKTDADIVMISGQLKDLQSKCDELVKLLQSLLEGKSPVPVEGLKTWYPFNGNADDKSGNNLNGSVIGAKLTTDRFQEEGKAYSFTTDQSISVPNSGAQNHFPMTISLWYNVQQVPTNGSASIFKKYQEATWNGYMIGVCDCSKVPNGDKVENNGFGVFPWYLRSNENRVLGYYTEPPFIQSNIQLNKWYHYVYSVDQSGGKIYVNGELIETDTWTGQSGNAINNLIWQIGGRYDANWFKGKIDDIGVWNRALSANEIKKIYTGEGF